MKQAVYLLHFREKHGHAGHYLGWAKDLKRRLARHRSGNGARLIAVILAAGNDFMLARTWEGGDKVLERRLKRQKNAAALCPVCQGNSDFTPYC